MDTAKFDDAYFKAADKKKGGSKKTEGEFLNEVRLGVNGGLEKAADLP